LFFREDPGPSIKPNLAVTSKQEVTDNQRKQQPLLQAKDKHEQKSKVSAKLESHKHRSKEYRRKKTLASSHEPTTKGVDPHIRRKRQQNSSVK